MSITRYNDTEIVCSGGVRDVSARATEHDVTSWVTNCLIPGTVISVDGRDDGSVSAARATVQDVTDGSSIQLRRMNRSFLSYAELRFVGVYCENVDSEARQSEYARFEARQSRYARLQENRHMGRSHRPYARLQENRHMGRSHRLYYELLSTPVFFQPMDMLLSEILGFFGDRSYPRFSIISLLTAGTVNTVYGRYGRPNASYRRQGNYNSTVSTFDYSQDKEKSSAEAA